VKTTFLRVTLQLLVTLAALALWALPAEAGAATGAPSPFLPPYPDYGLPTHCISREAVAQYSRLYIAKHRLALCRGSRVKG
jgi:hypothetical protein